MIRSALRVWGMVPLIVRSMQSLSATSSGSCGVSTTV
jgi:hypothetical protein